jgi:hypothetical protein
MYAIDNLDSVFELEDVPQSSVGAPCPLILCGEQFLHLAYVVQADLAGWDGRTVRIVSQDTPDENCALVRFQSPRAHMFGPPNDEAFTGHPLAGRGLQPYSVAEVKNSSWIRTLERMNSVHPHHRKEEYLKLKHFIFAFHDSIFECVSKGFSVSVQRGSVSSVLRESWPEG